MEELDLSAFDNTLYHPGRPIITQHLVLYRPAAAAKRVRVKYPWRLRVGDHTWIGEDCWIDNLADVHIGSHACLSQGSYLCTGNHDWSDRGFSLRLGAIAIEDGAWVGARAVVCPGVTLGRLAILTAGSVANRNLPESEVHSGNPAVLIRLRPIGNQGTGSTSSAGEDRPS